MDANKKIDLDNPLYPNESKIMANIIQNHRLRLSVAASSSVPWIYLEQFWHTLQEDRSKYRLKFFSEMVLFFLNTLGFTLELRSPSNFMTTRLVQPWQSLGKIFARCLTTQVTWSHIQTAFADHANVILFCQQYTCRLGHYMTVFPKISRRARDKYHNLEDDAMVKNIFNSGSIKTVLE
ncbi:hypothetical protein Tco_1312578 [Tanacetum coccineum]